MLKYLSLLPLMLTACATKPHPVPKLVEVPVVIPCPVPPMRLVGPRPALAIENVSSDSPIDKDVDYWRATTMSLLGYVGQLELGIAERDAALEVCSDVN
jgi:hypothetical protein